VTQSPAPGSKVLPLARVTLVVAKPRPTSSGLDCPGDPLLGIYHPDRLQVLRPCSWFVGTVTAIRPEDDGDHHVDIAPDQGYGSFLDAGDREHQSGGLLVEIVKGQRLPVPATGEHISVFGTWVYDTTHGWNELHPIWAIKYLDTGLLVRALPPNPPLYNPDDNEGGSGAGTNGGGSGTGRSGGGSSGSDCDPNYTGACLHDGIGDYDCASGSGDGPNYVDVKVRIVGTDVFGLDGDGDGYGCE
jgi:uncharacterized membrane protein YgcG